MHELKAVGGVMKQSSGAGDESGRQDEPVAALSQRLPDLSWGLPESGKTLKGPNFKNFVE